MESSEIWEVFNAEWDLRKMMLIGAGCKLADIEHYRKEMLHRHGLEDKPKDES